MGAKAITRGRVDELLRFLPLVGTPGPHAEPVWHGLNQPNEYGEFTCPYPEYPPAVEAFFLLAARPWWTDYGYAESGAAEMIQDDAAIANATLAQVRSMLTYCVRGERFCGGFWAAMIQEGRVGALLRRLEQLRGDGSGG